MREPEGTAAPEGAPPQGLDASERGLAGDPREALRRAARRVEGQLPLDCSPALREAWKGLVDAMGLGPAPELRECPTCGQVGMRAATRCGYCWSSLGPAPA